MNTIETKFGTVQYNVIGADAVELTGNTVTVFGVEYRMGCRLMLVGGMWVAAYPNDELCLIREPGELKHPTLAAHKAVRQEMESAWTTFIADKAHILNQSERRRLSNEIAVTVSEIEKLHAELLQTGHQLAELRGKLAMLGGPL